MHKIIVTSEKFTGSLEFELEDDQVVKIFRNQADLNPKQLQWLCENFPITLDRLNAWLKAANGSLKAELVEMDLSFDTFWEKYGMKRNKIRAERYWNKLKDADKLLALKNLNPYHAFLERNPQQAKMYPDSYLNPNERKFENQYR